MGVVKLPASLVPKSTEGQMMAVLRVALLALFATMIVLELVEHDTPIETAASSHTLERLKTSVAGAGPRRWTSDVADVVAPGIVMPCRLLRHRRAVRDDGDVPRRRSRLGIVARTRAVASIRSGCEAGHARLTRDDFSYRKCGPWEIDLPMDGIVISLQLQSGRWLNAEVHPHEWHFRQKLDWMLKVGAAFVFVGAVALFFMRRLGQAAQSADRGGAQLRRRHEGDRSDGGRARSTCDGRFARSTPCSGRSPRRWQGAPARWRRSATTCARRSPRCA